MASRLTHTGMTDELSYKNIKEYIAFRFYEFLLRISESKRETWLETLGIAPYGRFDPDGHYIKDDANQDLVERIRKSSKDNTNLLQGKLDAIWEVTLPHPDWYGEEIKILHITDTHIMKGKEKEFLKAHAGLLNKKYDLIIHSGDIVHYNLEDLSEEIIDFFRMLDSEHKYFIGGNHDGKTWDEYQKISKRFSASGFKDISYKVLNLEIKGRKIDIVGFPDRSLYQTHPYNWCQSWKVNIYNTLKSLRDDAFRIAVYHRICDLYDSFKENENTYILPRPKDQFHLVLAGHYHDLGLKLFNSDFFSAKFWLGFHGVINGLNNHFNDYMFPTSHTLLSLGPSSCKNLLFRVWDKFWIWDSLYFPLIGRLGVRKAGPQVFTLRNQYTEF